jgi:hypothetical protein
VVAGSISGTVQDTTGAAVPGAAVKATAVATGQVVTTKSDTTGLFVIPFLRVGIYSLEVSKEGFKRSTFDNVEVTVNADHGLGTIVMQVGQVTTMVEISAAPPLMQTTQSQITTSITTTELTTFPAMDFAIGMDAMVYMVPGVAGTRDNNRANSDGAQFSVNGLRGRADDEQIDGANNNDNSVTGPGMFVQNPDFVQEYQFTTNNFGPEYGRNAGSVVNIITKSGGNVWHGDLFVTEGNNKLNTLSNTQKAFQLLHTLPIQNDEYSGGSVGGAIIKDKVFMFSGFDNQIIPGSGSFATGSVTPTPAGLQTLAGCYPSSASLQALASYGPFGIAGGNPTINGTPVTKTVTLTTSTGASSCSFQAAGVQRLLSDPYHQYDLFERLDVNGSKDRVYGRMMYQKITPVDAAGSATGYPYSEPSLGEQWGVSWTRTLSASMFNQLQINYGRLGVQFGGNNIGNTVPPMNNWSSALASIGMPAGYAGYGVANNLPQGRIVNTYQLQDNWSWVHGQHQIKVGTNLTYQRSPNVFPANFNGTYAFSSINNYIADIPTSLSISLGNANLDFREHDSFWYVGDDYKVRPNLTLNLGLTYTYFGQPANLFSRLDTANETGSKPLYNPALPLSLRTFPVTPSPKTELGPSVGFAYNPTWWGGAGKTTLRGGYRLAYDPPYYNIYLNIATASPQVLAQTLPASGAPAFSATNDPVPIPAAPTGNAIRALAAPYLVTGVLDPRSVNQTNVTPNFAADHVQMWSFGIQRQLSAHAVLESRYVGNHGGGLFQSIDGNPLVSNLLTAFPNAVSGVTPCPSASAVVTTAVGRVNCNEGVVRTRSNTGVSDYNGWQTELRTTNLWNQLTMSTSFTWSKTTDNTSEIFSSLGGGNTVAISQNPLDYIHGEHALSGQNLPGSWTLTLYEDIPLFRNQHGVAGHFLGGWAVSGTYRIQSGQPYTPGEEFLAGNTGATWMDTAFNNGFFSYPSVNVRPFYGSPTAPISQVGIYAADACNIAGGPTATTPDPSCSLAANTLLSFNTFNTTSAPHVSTQVSSSAVRFIVNGKEAETVYGTPFGNVPRNPLRDYQINRANFAVYKTIKVTERVKARFDVSALNVFNHPNFGSVDAFLDDAGNLGQSNGFGIPTLTSGGARTIAFGLRIDF